MRPIGQTKGSISQGGSIGFALSIPCVAVTMPQEPPSLCKRVVVLSTMKE